jgi:hypothetical protein
VAVLLSVGRTAYADSLTLAWDPSTDSTVVGYIVRIGTAPGAYTQSVDVGLTTTYVMSNAVAGQQYFFTVVSYAAGPVLGIPSAEVSGYSNAPPSLAAPGNQSSQVGSLATLQLVGSDIYSDPLSYSASGLPPGLSVSAGTGLINGTPSTAGTYAVTATVSDGVLSASQPFTWTITGSVAGTATPLSPIGSITTTTPDFSWTAASNAASYHLEVKDSTGNIVISSTTTAANAGCGTGGTCHVSPGIVLSPGTATWQVQTITSSGTTAWSAPAAFSVPQPPDATAPSIVMTSPTSGAAFATSSQTVTVAGTANDNVGVSSVTWFNDRGGSGAASGTTSWSASVPLQLGTNNLIVSARDAGGNTSAVTLTVSYAVADTTAPSVAITSPTESPSYTVTNVASVSGTAADAGGVAQVSWSSSTGASGIASGTAAWSATVPLQLGINTITINARDNAGNTGSSSTMIVYLVPATPLAPSGTVSTPTPIFTWNPSPVVTTYLLRVNDGTQAGKIAMTLTPAAAGCSAGGICTAVPGVVLAPGAATWSVDTIVGTGNVASAPMAFTVPVDRTPPVVTISAPTGKSQFNTGAALVSLGGTALDANTVSVVSWSTDQGASGVAVGTRSWSADVPLGYGLNVVTISARDAFGNTGTAVLTIRRTHAKK